MRSFSYLVSIFTLAALLSACTLKPSTLGGGKGEGDLFDEAKARAIHDATLAEIEAEQRAEAMKLQDLSPPEESE